ncbi:MAG: hypothetical protein ABEJ61_11420 [Haloferacaceae archaeon]
MTVSLVVVALGAVQAAFGFLGGTCLAAGVGVGFALVGLLSMQERTRVATGALASRLPLYPPGTRALRVAFWALWAFDLVAASLFFAVSHVVEVNPVTVFFYGLFGSAGVVLAAGCYAGLVVLVGGLLPERRGLQFLVAVLLVYAVFTVNNAGLLFFRISLLGL